MKAWAVIACVLMCGCFPPVEPPAIAEIEAEYSREIQDLSVLCSNLAIRTFGDETSWNSAPDATSFVHPALLRVSVFSRGTDGTSRGRDLFRRISPETLIPVSAQASTTHGSTAYALHMQRQGSDSWQSAIQYEKVVATNQSGMAYGFQLLLSRGIMPEASKPPSAANPSVRAPAEQR